MDISEAYPSRTFFFYQLRVILTFHPFCLTTIDNDASPLSQNWKLNE